MMQAPRLLLVIANLWIITNVRSWTSIARQSRSIFQRSFFPQSFQSNCILQSHKEEECLIPIPNPNSNPHSKSLSGVSYASVSRGIDALYPPHELEKRNAHSRTDGYWKYVSRGEDPPKEFTYGEFDVEFFGELLDIAWNYFVCGNESGSGSGNSSSIPWKDKVFCDIGSGAGRLVLSAAALHPHWKLCRGLEILPTIHDVSVQVLNDCKLRNVESANSTEYSLRIPNFKSNETIAEVQDDSNAHLPLAPIHLTCGSFTDPYECLYDLDCAFVFSSCMKPQLLNELSIAIGRQLRPGSIIITTEFPLVLRGTIDPLEEDDTMPHGDYEIELLDKIDGWCWLMGGQSTAYIHRVKKSLWKEYDGPRTKPVLSLEDEAYRLVQLIESGKLTDPKAFWRGVHNELSFRGIDAKSLSIEEIVLELISK